MLHPFGCYGYTVREYPLQRD